MPRFPIEYEIQLSRGDTSPLSLRSGQRPSIAAGPPLEFGGTDAWWSPEHLFAAATAACFAATLSAAAARANVRIGAFDCHGRAILDRTQAGAAFTAVYLDLRLRVLADDLGRARSLVEDAKRQCFVANSLRCPVHVSAEVTSS